MIGLAGCATGADFFPLEAGNTWTYREARTGQTFTIAVEAPVALNGQTYYGVTGYVDSRQLVRTGDGGQLLALDEGTGSENPLTGFSAGW